MTIRVSVAHLNNDFIATLSDGRRFEQNNLKDLADVLHHAGIRAHGVRFEWRAGLRMITAGQQVSMLADIHWHNLAQG